MVVLDPMAGQAFSLAGLALRGAQVWLGDINPAALLLGALRDPYLIVHRAECKKLVEAILCRVTASEGDGSPPQYLDAWISPSAQDQLIEYADLSRLVLYGNPFDYDAPLWSVSPEQRLLAALPLLVARQLTLFRTSDNITWTRPGGLARATDIRLLLGRALEEWLNFAETQASAIPAGGRIHTCRMNAEVGRFGGSPKVDLIATSPPYANRLDYTRMWAPELETLLTMYKLGPCTLKCDALGTTVVHGKRVPSNEVIRLPKAVRQALAEIRDDRVSKASDTYYYPFFRNYAVGLARALRLMVTRLRKSGRVVVFVRDTTRKDVLFPTGNLVRSVLRAAGLRERAVEKRLIREHIGLRRRASTKSLYGLTQQEWWLVFEREST